MGLGLQELLVVFFIVLLLLGASRLPKLARSLGEAAGELRRALSDHDPREDAGEQRGGRPDVSGETERAAGE